MDDRVEDREAYRKLNQILAKSTDLDPKEHELNQPFFIVSQGSIWFVLLSRIIFIDWFIENKHQQKYNVSQKTQP